MKELEGISIGRSSIPALSITILLCFAMPVLLFVFWRRRHRRQTTLGYLAAGAAGFLVSARVLELGVHYICLIADSPVSRFLNGSTPAFVLYGITMAGVFEECGRYVTLRYILKKNRTRENAVLYGIGHGGIEVLTVLLPALVSYLIVAVLFSRGDPEAALRALNITEDTAAAALPSVQAAASFDFAMAAMNVAERLLAMAVHIGLTVLVFHGIRAGKRGCLPLAVALHMLVDTFPALYQRGLVPLWSVEAWAALWAAVIAFIAVKAYNAKADNQYAQA